MITPSQLITEARGWLGVPWHHQGTSKAGCDCVGFIVGLCRSLNLLPDYFEAIPYGREPDGLTLLAEVERYSTPVQVSEAAPGHVLVFRIRHQPRHFALMTHLDSINAPGMLHAYHNADGEGEVTEHILDDQFWRPRIVAAFAVPGVDYTV
ncbi:MAG: NlpC/P60 family protein [Thermosynechococcaceae cyanobacterium MS004]|nr:NlpC/P60 family protein [Thermosynechococcaceae cyanobacterium MS004]